MGAYVWVPYSLTPRLTGLRIGSNASDRDRWIGCNTANINVKAAYYPIGGYYSIASAISNEVSSGPKLIQVAVNLTSGSTFTTTHGFTGVYGDLLYASGIGQCLMDEAIYNVTIPIYSSLESALAAMDDGNWDGHTKVSIPVQWFTDYQTEAYEDTFDINVT